MTYLYGAPRHSSSCTWKSLNSIETADWQSCQEAKLGMGLCCLQLRPRSLPTLRLASGVGPQGINGAPAFFVSFCVKKDRLQVPEEHSH